MYGLESGIAGHALLVFQVVVRVRERCPTLIPIPATCRRRGS